jgi:dynein light chain Tctex-type 1
MQLGALVEETSQKREAGSSTLRQPQFKYVVNSTIIQHAAFSSSPSGDDTKKMSGRRGMHAASGAYWNNDKDGMWSFKYPGADSKGLDVVIGVIWVWVG